VGLSEGVVLLLTIEVTSEQNIGKLVSLQEAYPSH
jgi:hypothetical protein